MTLNHECSVILFCFASVVFVCCFWFMNHFFTNWNALWFYCANHYLLFLYVRCYARLHPRAVNCRKKKCGHSNQVFFFYWKLNTLFVLILLVVNCCLLILDKSLQYCNLIFTSCSWGQRRRLSKLCTTIVF